MINILVPTDFTPASVELAESAIKSLNENKANIFLFHAFELPYFYQDLLASGNRPYLELMNDDLRQACKRLKEQYPKHIELLLFIGLLPFSVIEYFGFVEVPLVMAISACFLLIEKMAIHLQYPFENKPTDTPMTTIAKGIEQNLMQLYAADINCHIETTTIYTLQKEEARQGAEFSRQLKVVDHQITGSPGYTAEKTYYLM